MRRTVLILSALFIAAALVLAAWPLFSHRARHLAVPVLADPSLEIRAAAPLAEVHDGCPADVRFVVQVPGRVTAIAVASDALFVGTFDGGVYRVPARPVGAAEARPVGDLRGKEQFVNALVEYGGFVWVATYRGVVVVDPAGRRVVALLRALPVEALAVVGSSVVAGTPKGIYRMVPGFEPEDLGVTGPTGEAIRVTALATSGETLWMGSPSGAYAIRVADLSGKAGDRRRATWQPLVFGDPGADTDVVTALAPFEGGVMAGTDNGGLVRLWGTGRVEAMRFDDAVANEVNPGAAAAMGEGTFFGTQGGGVLVAVPRGTSVLVGRLAPFRTGHSGARVSAVWAGETHLLVGTEEGLVLQHGCDPSGDRFAQALRSP